MQRTTVSAPARDAAADADALDVAELLARTGLERQLGRRWDHDAAAVLTEFGLQAAGHGTDRALSDLDSAAVISSGDTPGGDAFAAFTFCINSAQNRTW